MGYTASGYLFYGSEIQKEQLNQDDEFLFNPEDHEIAYNLGISVISSGHALNGETYHYYLGVYLSDYDISFEAINEMKRKVPQIDSLLKKYELTSSLTLLGDFS